MTARAKGRFNTRKYGEMLADIKPRPIQSEAENERLLAVVDRLMSKGDEHRTPEEEVELLSELVERFEQDRYPIPDSPPHRVLQFLLEQNELRQSDLLPILGSRGHVSDIVNGKRAISRTNARALGEFFHVSPELFI